MAKRLIGALDAPTLTRKHFFYISRATLSALWVMRAQRMPTIVFPELLGAITDDAGLHAAFAHELHAKSVSGEADAGMIDTRCVAFIREAYAEIMAADVERLPPRQHLLDNDDLRRFVAEVADA